MPKLRRRVRVLGLVLVAVATTLVSAPAPAVALAPASSSHPYSAPRCWPLRVETNLDCIRNNPGCVHTRDFWAMSLVPSRQTVISRAKAYAMGAGILHVGDARGISCGHGNSSDRWVWIDHGAAPCPATDTSPRSWSRTAVTSWPGSKLTVRWKKAASSPSVRYVMVEQSVRHADGSYATPRNQIYKYASIHATSYTFSGLHVGSTYRTRVSFASTTYWSLSSPWKLANVS